VGALGDCHLLLEQIPGYLSWWLHAYPIPVGAEVSNRPARSTIWPVPIGGTVCRIDWGSCQPRRARGRTRTESTLPAESPGLVVWVPWAR